jgi:hypothetical protein
MQAVGFAGEPRHEVVSPSFRNGEKIATAARNWPPGQGKENLGECKKNGRDRNVSTR